MMHFLKSIIFCTQIEVLIQVIFSKTREQDLKTFLAFFVELHSSLVFVSNLLVNLQSPRYELECSPVMLFQLVNSVLDSKGLRLLVDDVDHVLPPLLQLQ